MFKKEKKFTVFELTEQLKALDKFGIDIYEAEIKIDRNGYIKVTDKKSKTSAHFYVNDALFDNSVHIYTHK